jgi:predicted permease
MPGLEALAAIFVQTVLPVFLVAGAGYLLATFVTIDDRSVGRLLFYLATPSLVFRSLYETQLDATALRHLAMAAVSAAVLTALLGWLISYDQERRRRVAVVLTSAVSNNGNMGIPISYFAFGDAGMALATVYYVIMSFMSNTFGAVVASAGQQGVRDALKTGLRVPVLYAATAGILLNRTGVAAPESLLRAVDLMAGAAIPGMLILLGVQLRMAPIVRTRSLILRSMSVRLLASPLIAWLICILLGVSGVERNVIILQAAMPTAVITGVIATEFDASPSLVATIILFSTAVSIVTLSFILWLLL